MVNEAFQAPQAPMERRWYYVGGKPVELWENAETPFGWSSSDLEAYATTEKWDLLFNALVLSSMLDSAQPS
jgi:hypothetical protein